MVNPSVINSSTSGGQSEKKRGSFFTGFLSKKILGVKRKARAISTIDDIVKIDSKTIQIIFVEKNGNKKAIVYECQTGDNCSEIVAKLNFLRVSFILLMQLEKSRKATDFKKESRQQVDACSLESLNDKRFYVDSE